MGEKKTIPYICDTCGIDCFVRKSQIKKGTLMFCSRRCKNVYAGKISKNLLQHLPNRQNKQSRKAHRYTERHLIKIPCEICGKIQADAHHNDYENIKEVRWLCRKHHFELHKKEFVNLPSGFILGG